MPALNAHYIDASHHACNNTNRDGNLHVTRDASKDASHTAYNRVCVDAHLI
jgi:hypothetical protein